MIVLETGCDSLFCISRSHPVNTGSKNKGSSRINCFCRAGIVNGKWAVSELTPARANVFNTFNKLCIIRGRKKGQNSRRKVLVWMSGLGLSYTCRNGLLFSVGWRAAALWVGYTHFHFLPAVSYDLCIKKAEFAPFTSRSLMLLAYKLSWAWCSRRSGGLYTYSLLALRLHVVPVVYLT